MKRLFLHGLAAIAVTTSLGTLIPTAQATFRAAAVSESGVLRSGLDHFFEVTVEESPLQRIRVKCVTFHELDKVDIFVGGQKIQPDVRLGFEEFILTFNDAIPAKETIRIVMRNSQIRGTTTSGITVPYQVFGTYPSLNNAEVPLGTAIVRIPAGR